MTDTKNFPDIEPLSHEYMRIICQHCSKTIDVPVYCGNRFCEVCSVPRRMRIRQRLEFLVKNIDIPKHHKMKHLTLTIPNQEDLFEMVRHLIKSFRKLRNRSFWKNHVIGGAFVLEVTGRPHNWHVHIHAIIVSRYLDWNKLLKNWLSCSKGRGVYISDIPAGKAVGYLTKYLTKPSVPESVLDDVNWALKGLRMFSPFGSWYHTNKLYVKPKSECPDCHQIAWFPLDLCFGDHISTFEKVLSKPPPDDDTKLEKCPATSELSFV